MTANNGVNTADVSGEGHSLVPKLAILGILVLVCGAGYYLMPRESMTAGEAGIQRSISEHKMRMEWLRPWYAANPD